MLRIVVLLDGGWYWSPTLRRIYKRVHGIDIGYGTYGGALNVMRIPRGTVFGRYCSTGLNIRVFNANHPKAYFTLHPMFYNPDAGCVSKETIARTSLKVGNDVWIGESVIILPGVRRIGDGAIIGAGSVVTKDVEPYTIVAGNPAVVKSKRFDDDVVEKLQQSRWWELDKDQLFSRRGEFERCVNFSLGNLGSQGAPIGTIDA